MMQSVYAARWLLHALALLLAICAVTNQATWDVVHVPARAAAATAISHSVSTNGRGSNNTLARNDVDRATPAARVTFAPGRYCIVRDDTSEHATHECHEYVYLLNRVGNDAVDSTHHDAKNPAQVSIHAATERDIAKFQDTADRDSDEQTRKLELDRVVASWCRIQSSGSWFVQGAQSMVCLVVLDTCLYTMVFWLLVSGVATALALASCLWPAALATLESLTAFCSYVAALLGVFLTVEWWGYSTYFIDAAALQTQSLSWRYGMAFKLVCGSVLLSLVAARITLHLAVRVQTNYAQLHMAPPTPELSAAAAVATPRAQSPRAERDVCHDTSSDPLQCPPNYLV